MDYRRKMHPLLTGSEADVVNLVEIDHTNLAQQLDAFSPADIFSPSWNSPVWRQTEKERPNTYQDISYKNFIDVQNTLEREHGCQ